jgi:DNA-binding response OmpR family regulator
MPARILSISYNLILLNVRQQLFERNGYEVVSAKNFEEAQGRVREGGYDVVVLGHSLPNNDKERIYNALKRDCPAPVISVSVEAEHDLHPASAWVDPFQPDELLKAVKTLTKKAGV